MKLLTTEQQVSLRELLEALPHKYQLDSSDHHQLNYWSIELKPKRTRKPKADTSNVT